jgi:Mg2+ and Co2+ transporter CorA
MLWAKSFINNYLLIKDNLLNASMAIISIFAMILVPSYMG